jgi:DNA topoisomerase IA
MLILCKKSPAVKDFTGGGETVIICVTGHLFRLRDPEAYHPMHTSGGVFPSPIIPPVFRSEKIKKISAHRELVKSWLKSPVQDSVIIAAGAGRVQTTVLNAAAVRNAETAGFVRAPVAGRETPPQSSNGTTARTRGKGQSYGLQVF